MNDIAPDAPAGMGHNAPPTEDTTTTLQRLYSDYVERVKVLEERAPNIKPPTNEIEAERLADFAKKQVADLKSSLDDLRVQEKKPHLDAGRAIDNFFGKMTAALDAIYKKCKQADTAYRVEQQRIAAEKARQEAEAAAKVAAETQSVAAKEYAESTAKAAAEPPKVVTHGVHGARASLRTEWRFRVVDAAKVPRKYCVPDEKLIRAAVKAAGDDAATLQIAGVEIYEHKETSYR